MTDSAESLFEYGKPVWTALGIGMILVLSIWIFNNWYVTTPEYEEKISERQKELDAMSCDELFIKIKQTVPKGYTVGGQGMLQQGFIDEFEKRGCLTS